jgi:hypothetical protein
MNKYIDLIKQTFDFPTKEFKVEENELMFNGVNLMEIIKTYGTPLKLTYLPKFPKAFKMPKPILAMPCRHMGTRANTPIVIVPNPLILVLCWMKH